LNQAIGKRKCQRCGHNVSIDKCFERKIDNSFNEVLCDRCVESLKEYGILFEFGGGGIFSYQVEGIIRKILEHEKTIDIKKSRIKDLKFILKRIGIDYD